MKNKKKQAAHDANIKKDHLLPIGNKVQNLCSEDEEDDALIDQAEKVDFIGMKLDTQGRALPGNKKTKSLKDEEN